MFAPTFPTDRDRDAPDLGVGIDTVAVMGETTENLLFELRSQSFDRELDYDTGAIVETPRFASMDVQVALASCRLFGFRRDGRAWLRAELSLPTMLRGQNRNPLDRTLLPDAVEAALILLEDHLPDVPAMENIVVQRLDLARDFAGVQSAHSTLSAFSRRHVPYARVNDPRHRGDGTMQSLMRGSKSEYLVRGYDKGYELLGASRTDRGRRDLLSAWAAVSEGRFRYELELRPSLLRRKGLNHMADLTPSALDAVAREYFQRARWDAPYGGSGRVESTLTELRQTLSRADYRNLCSYLYWTERGMHVDLDRKVLDRIRPLARKHNLLDKDDDRELRRLDFDSGTESVAE